MFFFGGREGTGERDRWEMRWEIESCWLRGRIQSSLPLRLWRVMMMFSLDLVRLWGESESEMVKWLKR